ncbi:hypothetical protein [Duganella sp. Root1480D1]|uniref:hypothetical protein n=1 Tax=Duganella sp. Root1480D1 TaxID=1736471 RepID=UPI00070DF29A|nr:hypothetical protein [Duganella sp. Root1480D1]KQZ44794.1 hypothetical protein ASD58_00600 [Duganella sp. Root1480D1]
MIVLPDDDEIAVGAQVNAVIGEALRQSVAEVEPSAGFQARLAAALDALGQGGRPGPAPAEPSGQVAGKGEQMGVAGGTGKTDEPASGAGQGSEAVEAAS